MGHLRPYRGKKSAATRSNIVLKRGEIFLEIPESGVGTGAGKFKVGDGTTVYSDLPYFMGDNAGAVKSVNQIQPDDAGNVTLSTVPYAENLVSPDNIEEVDTFIFRTTAGETDSYSGTAHLNMIGGNCVIDNNIITVATPTAFKAIGFNQFDKTSMVLSGYSINNAGAVIAQSGSYVCYIHAVGGLDTGYTIYSPAGYITKVGFSTTKPTTSSTGIILAVDNVNVAAITNNATSSALKNIPDGYICVVVTNTSDLVVHPKWTGTKDTDIAEYSESIIQIPTTDINGNNLPTATYGFPSVNEVRDEINLAQRTYTQRIGYYPYSVANLNTVKALDVDYIYDGTYIFYVLTNPITYNLATTVSSEYIANDYGTEEFLNTYAGVYSNILYGANLRDKLRRDVVTISEQHLSEHQKAEVRNNIDAAANHLVFEEAADAPNLSLLNTIISGNPMNTIMGANKRLLRRYNDQIASKVASVNTVLPDKNGDVTINRVPMADNLYSPDNNENYEGYLCRTSGGSSDLTSGTAQLSYIRGTMSSYGRVAEELNGNYDTSYIPGPEETYVTPSISTIDAAKWRASSLGTNSGTYTFTYNGTAWTYNSATVDLSTYGINVYGTVKENDTIVVTYVKENRGTLQTLKPTQFIATGLNVCSGSLANTGINSSTNKIIAKSGSYLYYAKAPYSDNQGYIAYESGNKITNIGFVATTATPAVNAAVDRSNITLGSSISTCIVPNTSDNDNTGWVVVECSASSDAICIHPRWSGGNDTVAEAYTTTSITMPTVDANNNSLPYVSYGLPAVGSVADEINFDLKQYIQRVGHYTYSEANLATVQALGVDYDYDLSHIFYVLTSPIVFNLAATVSGVYTVNDYGIEYFNYTYGIGNRVNGNVIYSCHLYGQNLRDKLRRDVLTISQQTLTDAQKTQVLSNIGAASAASVTQLNNELAYSKIRNFGFQIGYVTGGQGWYRILTFTCTAATTICTQFTISNVYNWSEPGVIKFNMFIRGSSTIDLVLSPEIVYNSATYSRKFDIIRIVDLGNYQYALDFHCNQRTYDEREKSKDNYCLNINCSDSYYASNMFTQVEVPNYGCQFISKTNDLPTGETLYKNLIIGNAIYTDTIPGLYSTINDRLNSIYMLNPITVKANATTTAELQPYRLHLLFGSNAIVQFLFAITCNSYKYTYKAEVIPLQQSENYISISLSNLTLSITSTYGSPFSIFDMILPYT